MHACLCVCSWYWFLYSHCVPDTITGHNSRWLLMYIGWVIWSVKYIQSQIRLCVWEIITHIFNFKYKSSLLAPLTHTEHTVIISNNNNLIQLENLVHMISLPLSALALSHTSNTVNKEPRWGAYYYCRAAVSVYPQSNYNYFNISLSLLLELISIYSVVSLSSSSCSASRKTATHSRGYAAPITQPSPAWSYVTRWGYARGPVELDSLSWRRGLDREERSAPTKPPSLSLF